MDDWKKNNVEARNAERGTGSGGEEKRVVLVLDIRSWRQLGSTQVQTTNKQVDIDWT